MECSTDLGQGVPVKEAKKYHEQAGYIPRQGEGY